MENLTLSPTTRTALQKFLQIWKQDPLAQQTLCIAPQNIFICDPQRLDQITDITASLEEPSQIDRTEQENNFAIEEFINIELDNDKVQEVILEELKATTNTEETKNIQELLEDLNRLLKPIESRPNPFLALNWEEQVKNIIKRLQESRKSKKGRIGILEAHYYLGKLLEENISHHDQIKRQLEQQFGERRTRDLWISAQRQRELFTTCDKSRLYQNETITITKILKLKETEFTILLSSLSATNL